jgi:hypothetical protein
MMFCGVTRAEEIKDPIYLCFRVKNIPNIIDCEVKNRRSTVDITADFSSEAAHVLCTGIANMMAKEDRRFGDNKKLRIFSPYSGDRPIAVCKLP